LLFESNPGKIWQEVFEIGFNTVHENQEGGFCFQTAGCHGQQRLPRSFPWFFIQTFPECLVKKAAGYPVFADTL